MKKRYRSILALIATLFCALLILGVGYAGIAFGGEEMLKISQEPEKITMSEDISNLFYSRIEDDVQLHPWNYLEQENERDGDVSAENVLCYMEEDLYMLIAVAADVEVQEVIRWYYGQDKTILTDTVSRYVEEIGDYYFFYDDVIRLNGREYHVKFCSDSWNLYSISCLRPKEENIRDSEEWSEKKEHLSSILNRNEIEVYYMYNEMAGLSMMDGGNWLEDVELYLFLDRLFREFENSGIREEDSEPHQMGQAGSAGAVVGTDSENEKIQIWRAEEEIRREGRKGYGDSDLDNIDFDLQMIELDDCILLMNEQYGSPAIYYDVMEQKVAGFHFFY